MNTDFLWKRYDLCAQVNAQVNGTGHTGLKAIQEKARALVEGGVPEADLRTVEVSIEAGAPFIPVLLVEDQVATWVLRDPVGTQSLPEALPKRGVTLRDLALS